MNEQEYRAQLRKQDEASLDERVKRWRLLVPATYDVTLPNLAWSYITEAVDMFIRGHFIGVILLCAGIVELGLADQLMSKLQMTREEVERFKLEQMVVLSRRLEIINDQEAKSIDKLRKLRNALIHANAGKLGQMARKSFKDSGLDTSDVQAEFFLQPPWEGGIDQDALSHLELARTLTVQFYGASE